MRLLAALLLLAPMMAFAGTITVTDSNGDTYELTLSDDIEVTADGALRLRVGEQLSGAPNQPPVAMNDMGTVTNTGYLIVDVIANDSDSDGVLDPTSIVLVGPSKGGSFSIDTAGSVRFVPDLGFLGTATTSYRVSDSQGGQSNLATISVLVNQSDCPSDPVPGFSLRGAPSSLDHCNFNVSQFLTLASDEYLALDLNMFACPETKGAFLWAPQAGNGDALRVTISRCPGVVDDSFPPIPGDPFEFLCSHPAIAEGNQFWSIAADANRCRAEPGQRVFLNIVYGSSQNPPNPTCTPGSCGFILTPVQ